MSAQESVSVLTSIEQGCATVMLNRPEAYNALNLELAEELLQALIRCDQDPAVRAVLLTGAGKAFCSGGDIRQMQDHADRDGDAGRFLKTLTVQVHGAISTIMRMSKPVVMAVNGPAAGGGMSLALAGDIILASDRAAFTVGYSAIAAAPDGGMSFHLPRLVGPKLAFELTWTNRPVNAVEAKELGFVAEVFPESEFRERSVEYVKKLASGPTRALAHAKRLFASSHSNGSESQMEDERQAISDCGRTEDFRNGIDAFLKKRTPVFFGR